MKSYNKAELEHHPEYWDFIVTIINAQHNKLYAEGLRGKELDDAMEEFLIEKELK